MPYWEDELTGEVGPMNYRHVDVVLPGGVDPFGPLVKNPSDQKTRPSVRRK
jgi:hypothetical protein